LICATVVQLTTDNRTAALMTMSAGTVLLVVADAVTAATDGSGTGNLLRLVLVVGGAVLTVLGVGMVRSSPVAATRPDDSRVRQVLTMALLIIAIGGFMVAMSGHSTDTVSRLASLVVLGCFAARGVYRGRRARALLAQLAEQALTDPLTGLGNRRALTEALHAAAETDAALCVVSIDVDRFKDVNQHLGHEVGDRVLATVARVLREHCPGVPFRLGGDEFAVLTPLSEEEAVLGAEGLRQVAVEAFAEIPGIEPLSITLSIGIAGGRSGAGRPDPLEVLIRSGQALRVAKLDRDRVRLYSDDDARRLAHRALLEQRLRHAVAGGGIGFVFQPVVDLTDGRAVAVETLARWNDEVLGEVSPVEFVPVAEQIGVVHELGRQALQAGIELAGRLTRHGRSLGVSVNVSPVQLRRASFVTDLTALLADAGVAASMLTLEVTEGVFIDLDDPAVLMLQRLSESGIPIAIDDFGTGYSSLGYMTRLPASIVKLDRTLTQRVDEPRTRSVIEAMLGVAGAHDIVLIMEGVESPTHADLLSQLGVRLAQGWLWARAMPADELIRWLAAPADRRPSPAVSDRASARHRTPGG
jgi:diguanylate cyclase (GGDEF)-like protein